MASNAVGQIPLANATDFLNILQSRELTLIGIEEGISTPQRRYTALWQVSPHIADQIDPKKMPAAFWAGIRAAANRNRQAKLEGICSSIAFSLTAMGRHLLALSNEYNRELHAALERGTKPTRQFRSIETYDLWLAIHAFLLAGGSARDYLAQAVVNFVFHDDVGNKERRKLDSMGELLKHGKKGVICIGIRSARRF